MKSLDSDLHFVMNINSSGFNITESTVFNDLDLSKNPEVESRSFTINFSLSVNLDDCDLLFNFESPFVHGTVNSELTIGDDNLD